uniref:1-acyl-sn-glycerol-3-phosphate acyltransferase n=1 Tax=Candidatus Kentrum sp. FW TaxID=2126338 RepID=A0A450RZM7_9GAMM|nr:MAG: 1-acyl-sn-glycerol-3-phosphate acyltransferase [Candidatus Kentron sp. FW]VFJ50478.1 MAG: 1-acyl-sn-glycerol-3-phosphate acyltransferase [Candidatus Kentron sp. FW]
MIEGLDHGLLVRGLESARIWSLQEGGVFTLETGELAEGTKMPKSQSVIPTENRSTHAKMPDRTPEQDGFWEKSVLVIRATIFFLMQFISVIAYAPVCLLALPISFPVRHRFVTLWIRWNLWCLAKICSLEYQVEGKENIPATVGVVLGKHESAWETLALQAIFQPQVWVLKRELLWVPFLGWGLAVLNPIAIDRRAARRALTQVVQQGRERLKAGIWVVIFPEGTRVVPGETKPYLAGGAMLAKQAGCYVLPVAHNAADFWKRRGFVKRPGKIRVVIGPAIESENRGTAEINTLAQRWIEDTMKRIRTL